MPAGVAGRRLATLLGAVGFAAALAACSGSQIDERTATRRSFERGAATTAAALPIPVGGRADDAFGGVDGFRIEATPSDLSSSFVSDLATLPDAVELTESVGLRYVSAQSSSGNDAIVIALAMARSEVDRLTSLENALIDGVSGGSPTENVTLAGESAVLVEAVDEQTGQSYQAVFWRGDGLDLLVVGLVDDRAGIEKIATAFIEANTGN